MSVRGEFAAIVRTADVVAIASGPHFCYVVCPLHVGVRITKEDQDGKVYCVHELHGGARGDGHRQHELDYGSLKGTVQTVVKVRWSRHRRKVAAR